MCKDIIFACMVLYAPFPFNLICNINTFRKKVLTFCVCMQNICYHIAVCVVPFNLIRNMTRFQKKKKKKKKLASVPPAKSTQWIGLNSCMICFISIVSLPVVLIYRHWAIMAYSVKLSVMIALGEKPIVKGINSSVNESNLTKLIGY